MSRTIIAPEEYYHIFNRGNNKQLVFLNDDHRLRFLISLLLFQSPLAIKNIKRLARIAPHNVQSLILHNKEMIDEIISQRFVELNCFTLMPNHFHLIVKETKEGGIANYMQRLQVGYTRYFNIKNEKSGHHFQGHYKAVHIKSNGQLLYVSTYIHRNPREISVWQGREISYPWSSFQDYVGNNRWGGLPRRDIILEQFNNQNEYRKFVNISSAKTLNSVAKDLLID